MYCCFTPLNQCSGPNKFKNARNNSRFHREPNEVLKCYGRYLMSLGYKRLSRREYLSPNDGTIFILPKKPPMARPGKAAEGAAKHNPSRYMKPKIY